MNGNGIPTFTPARIVESRTVSGRLWCRIRDSKDVLYWTPWECGKLYPDKGGLEKSVPVEELFRVLTEQGV